MLIRIILSWLLHHANRHSKSEHFYTIKAKILARYGVLVGHDFQRIEGKSCWTCSGSGVWVGYSWYSNRKYSDICNKCGGSGWYIPSHWNVLERISFGEYLFHKPVGRSYNKPEVGSTIIEGYVEHNPSKFSYIARIILNLLYDCRGYKKRWRFGFGSGYYINHGWKINRLFNNLVYVIKHKGNYLPIIKKRMASVRPAVTGSLDVAMDYLPF